jgi:hypothetical protein
MRMPMPPEDYGLDLTGSPIFIVLLLEFGDEVKKKDKKG